MLKEFQHMTRGYQLDKHYRRRELPLRKHPEYKFQPTAEHLFMKYWDGHRFTDTCEWSADPPLSRVGKIKEDLYRKVSQLPSDIMDYRVGFMVLAELVGSNGELLTIKKFQDGETLNPNNLPTNTLLKYCIELQTPDREKPDQREYIGVIMEGKGQQKGKNVLVGASLGNEPGTILSVNSGDIVISQTKHIRAIDSRNNKTETLSRCKWAEIVQWSDAGLRQPEKQSRLVLRPAFG